MFRLMSHGRSRRASFVAAVVGVLALVACTPATASNVRVSHVLFGMHDGTATGISYGKVHEGAVRLWDVGTQWNQIQTRRSGSKYNWTRLDSLVRAAHKHHAEVTLVVAGTPRFYSRTPWNVPSSAVPAYKAFVRAAMVRYRPQHWGYRGIAAYQAWNEGNIKTFWTGTPAGLATITAAMTSVRNQVDPKALVVAPSMVTRLSFEQKALAKFYAQRVAGKPVWRYIDAVALSLYPEARYGGRVAVPEDSMRLLKQVRGLLRRDHVPGSKPIWNTEINYGMSGGRSRAAPASRQVANVMRTYLLNAAAGVKRVFWYRYDWGVHIANTLFTSTTNASKLTAAGSAYARIQSWMHGTLVGTRTAPPCQADRHGTYTCVVRSGSGTRRIYWNPFHGAKVKLAGNAHHLTNEMGGVSKVRPGATITVGYAPVLVGG